MPTTKPRITLTITGELEAVLRVERALHPDLSPTELVLMLAARGHEAAMNDVPRETLVRALAGGLHYPDDYLDELREDWDS